MPVNAFSDKSLVINLAHSRLVAGDENPVDTYIDDITHFKNAITGDPITVDRKYKDSLTFCFRGLVIQCMNSMPLSKDKTNSYYRRLLTIPFNANFAGIEKDEIKSVFIKDKRVLEYIVHKALMIDLQPNELVAPDAATELLNSYKENNDTILQWWNDCEDEFAWDRIPFKLLYASYDYWVQNYTAKRDRNISLPKFTREFKAKILPLMDDWELPNKDCKFGPSDIMRTVPEPLIAKYGLDEFKNPLYTGKDWNKIGSNGGQLKKEYRGIVKKK
jgi:putative DNA primase/helicase